MNAWFRGIFFAYTTGPLGQIFFRTPPAGVERQEYIVWCLANALGGATLWFAAEVIAFLCTHFQITRRRP